MIISSSELNSSCDENQLGIFGADQKIQINENSTLLLTSDFSNLNNMAFEEHKKIFQLIVDYFVPESSLVITPHPDDLMYYDYLFPQATVIKKKIPSELLPFVFSRKPKTIITLTPTEICNLTGFFENCLLFSTDYVKNFTITHQYYCALKIINELFRNYEVFEMNSDKLLLENLLNISGNQLGRIVKSCKNLSQIPAKSVVLIDDFNNEILPNAKEIVNFLKSTDKESIIIFLNSNKEYLFYDYPDKEILEYLIPVEILRFSTVDETDLEAKTIFVCTKRKDQRKMIKDQSFEKTLKSSKEIIKVNAMSEEQLRIKILEGILEATEKRLEHYIKLESELRKKLNIRMTE